MTTTRHEVTLPDGTTATRTSKTRTYSHVVIGEVERYSAPGTWTWAAITWSMTEANAAKAAASASRYPFYRNLEVREATR